MRSSKLIMVRFVSLFDPITYGEDPSYTNKTLGGILLLVVLWVITGPLITVAFIIVLHCGITLVQKLSGNRQNEITPFSRR